MNGFREKWRTYSTKRKVLWSIGIGFVLLVILGAALPGSKKSAQPQQSATVVHVESAAEKRQHEAENSKHEAEAKAAAGKVAKENAARAKHEAEVRRHEEHVQAVKERARKAREARKRAAEASKNEKELNELAGEEREAEAAWQSEEGREFAHGLEVSLKAQGATKSVAHCTVESIEAQYSPEEAAALAREVEVTGKPNKSVEGALEYCLTKG